MGTQVTVAASQVDKERLGYCAISLTHFTDTSEPSIVAGSKVEVGGALYEFTGDEAGTGWAGVGSGNTVYMYLVPAGASISWAYSITAPTWDTAKQGWYNGSNRAFAQLYKDSSGYGNKRFISSTYDPSIYGQFDLVIDSNSKLDLLCQAINGQYKRVLVRAGTWTASALSPTAGVLINLDNTGTTYMEGEKGSSIVYSGSYAGSMYGLYHSAIPTDFTLENFINISLTITNTSANAAYGFRRCSNLHGCVATVTCSSLQAYSFQDCYYLSSCKATTSGSTVAYGFSSCYYLHGCRAGSTTTGAGNAVGFAQCNYVTDCVGVGTATSRANAGAGFTSCIDMKGCTGTGTGGPTGEGWGIAGCSMIVNCIGVGNGGATSGAGYGFYNNVGIVNSQGQGLATGAGVGYGFYTCKKCQQNKAYAASKTATYNSSYADSGAANACADTAAGGYNS